MKRTPIFFFWLVLCGVVIASHAQTIQTTQWSPVELGFTSAQTQSWRAFPLQVTFTQGQHKIQFDAYWDGGNIWKVRFAPPRAGEWKYTTSSTDAAMNKRSGTIRVTAPSAQQLQANANYRGQIKVGANGHHFTYADGTPVLILTDCQLFTRWPLATFQRIIAQRKEQGFNGVNLRLAKAKEKNEDGLPYLEGGIDQLNAAFFQGADARLKTLWEAGFVTFFMPDFLGQGSYTMQDARDVSRYMLARFAAFNVAYIITGEYDNFRRPPAKPTFYAEGIYENQPWAGDVGTDWHVRHQTWVPLVNGAAVVDYGEHFIKGGGIPATEVAQHLDQPGARQALYALRFRQKFDWWKLVPQREWMLVNGQVPPLAEPKANTALPYVLAEPGQTYVTYLMRGLENATLTLTHLEKKLYRASWFDPRTNRTLTINGGEPINTELRDEWTLPKRPAPADEDWVLLLVAGQEVTTGKAIAGIEDKTYFSKANNRDIKIKVYLPPQYRSHQTSKARYPVVYNLHGGGGSPERQWGRVGATLAEAMENKRVRPMIYVFAEGLGNTLFVNTAGTKLQVETTVINELIPFIDANYRTIAAREGRAIDGFSMGGFGALHFAFKYPELFSSVTAYGGALLTYDTLSARDKRENFGDSREYFNEHNPWAWAEKNATKIREMVKVRMVIGTKDWLYPRNVEFKAHLDKLKIPVSYQEVEDEEHCTKCLYEKAGLESLKLMEKAFTTPGKGNLQDRTYHSAAMNRPMRYKIYTPPGYETSKARYPVVYNLHGAGGGTPDRQWDRTHQVLIDAMETHKVRPMIYVFVDGLGSTMWADAIDGKRLTATTFIHELIPHVDATYRTIASKQGRAIDGFSMGGFGALMLSMKHPDLFSSAVSYGAAVVTFEALSKGIKRDAFADNAEHWAQFDPRAWLARNADAVRKGVRVRMICGTKDDLYAANLDFKSLLEKQNIPLSWQAVEGVGHDTTGLYRAVGVESLQFIERGFTNVANKKRGRRAR